MKTNKIKFTSVILTVISLFFALCTVSYADFSPADITTPHIVLMDAKSGSIIYEKAAHEQAYPASTTKIMTCILALESGKDLNETVDVGENIETSGSVMGFIRREELRFIDLIYGMMLVSGNDAAQAIAEHIAGSESAFAVMMNEKAAELGMNDTHFVKSNGLHDDNHYTTAYALLTKYAMQNEQFRRIVSAETYQVEPTNRDSDGYFLENTNKLLYRSPEAEESYLYSAATGVKTGSTPRAKRCLVASAEKNGEELILVLFEDEADDYRFSSAKQLFEWAFENTESINANELSLERTITRQVSNASFSDSQNGQLAININIDNAIIKTDRDTISAIKADPSLISVSIELNSEELTAPIYEGTELGVAKYSYNGSTLFTAPLTASRTVMDISNSTYTGPSGEGSIILEPLTQGTSGSGWLFWVLLIIFIIVLFIFMRMSADRKKRRRRRRRAYRYPSR